MPPQDSSPPSAATTPASLPWHWFEFRQEPRVLTPALLTKLHSQPIDEAAHQVWQIVVDGQPIPFKYLSRPSTGGQRRPTLMIVHGMGLTIASFRGVSAYLLATHDLILADYSGFSLSTAALPAHTSFQEFAAAIWRIADVLEIPSLSLAGNSLGGGLCLMAAMLAQQRVERILLSNPACFPQRLPRMYRLARIPLLGELLMAMARPEKFIGGLEYIGYVDKTRFDPALRATYMSSLANRRTRLRLMQIIRQLPANESDVAHWGHLARLGDIEVPVLITWGLKDPLLTAGAGERLAKKLPHAEYFPHENLAHMPHEEAPEQIGPKWAAFLNAGVKGDFGHPQ